MRYPLEKAQSYVFFHIRSLVKASWLLLVMWLIGRIIFMALFCEPLVFKQNGSATLSALFLGLRYDLIPVAYALLIPYLLSGVGLFINREGFLHFIRSFSKQWYRLMAFLVVAILVCDLGFYSYFQEHINVLFFGLMEDDTKAVLTSIWKNYNLPLWLSVLTAAIGIIFWIVGRIFKRERIDLFYAKPWTMQKAIACWVIGLVLIAFFGRGSFGRLALSIEDAHISEIEQINKVSVNGAIALNRALKIRREFGSGEADYLKKNKFTGAQEAWNAVQIMRGETLDSDFSHSIMRSTASFSLPEDKRPHVIVVVMESFGAFWWSEQSSSFNFLGEFEKHTQEDYLFLNFLSADNGTIGSITSIVASQPLRPGSRFLSEGKYMQSSLPWAANTPYEQNGYRSQFIYGGKPGWRQIGQWVTMQGFDRIIGGDTIRDELKLADRFKAKDIGNEWGVFDEYLFEYLEKSIQDSEGPTFTVVLTTSNHPPFEVPSSYKPFSLELTPVLLEKFNRKHDEILQRFIPLQYSNHTLGQFMTRLKASALANQTVVAVTGDHSFWMAKGLDTSDTFRKYAVPFYLYLPQGLRPENVDTSTFGSHEDIMPTLYEATLPNATYWGFGKSLLQGGDGAMNSYNLKANTKAVIFEGKSYCWSDSEYKRFVTCEASADHKALARGSDGLIGLVDYFLRKLVPQK